jgi:hypothetical protein
MGCFNVAGTMSNLSIGHGDKVVFIPLLQSCYSKKEGMLPIGAETMLVGDNGASMFFSPFCLPIVGEYNDYGSVENIVRDGNVEYLENYFGISIEQFMEQISRNWCQDDDVECKTPELTKELRSLAGMFEDFDVYKKMAAHFKFKDSAFEKSRLSTDVLEKVGLVLNTDISTNDKRFNEYYSFDDTKDFALFSDGSWMNLMDMKQKKVICSVYSLSCLEENLLEHGYKLKNTEQFKNITETELRLKKILIDRKKIESKMEETMKQIKIVDKDSAYMSRLMSTMSALSCRKILLFDGVYALKKWTTFSFVLDEVDDFFEPLLDLLAFNSMMYSTNNFFFPAMNGEQHGNEDASKVLYEACLKITNDKIDERDY